MNCCFKVALYHVYPDNSRRYVSVCGSGELEVVYEIGKWSFQPRAAGPYPLLGYSKFSEAVRDYEDIRANLYIHQKEPYWQVALFFCEGSTPIQVPHFKAWAQCAEDYKGAATKRITVNASDLKVNVGGALTGEFPSFTVGFKRIKPIELLADGGRRINIIAE